MKFSTAIFKTFFLSLCVIAVVSFAHAQTASILPNAKTTFTDQNGKPLTSGTVDFYVPGTTTRKTTWQDSAKTTANTNPVVLDAAGRAQIWGDGSYRQVVKDRNNNLVWDQVTSSIGSGGSSGSTIGDGLAVGTIVPTTAIIAPANYQFAYGQALSRSAYPELLAALTIQTSVGCVGGSPLVNVSDTTSISVGTVLESICAAGSPTVISKTSSTVTLSANSVVTVTTTGRFFPYGNGDALTTFNVADMRGYVPAGRCNMGGVDCSVLNSTYFSSNASNTPSGLNAKGGNQSKTLNTLNLPPYTPTVASVTGGAASFQFTTRTDTPGGGANTSVNNIVPSGGAFNVNTVFTQPTVTMQSQGGNSAPFSLVQPTLTLNYAIKVTPDANLTSTFGVAAIGGMTGIIACGSNVTCSGNTISFNWSGVNSIQGMSGNITCGTGLTCSAGTISATNTDSQVLASRTLAMTRDLSVFSVVSTLSYDGTSNLGGATFYKTAGTFIDTRITSGTITNNGTSGCTNGTYYTLPFTGGTGRGELGGTTGVITVSGNVVSSITNVGGYSGAMAVGYSAGDVLSVTVPGCSTTVTWTVATVSTPTGSFTDLAGNKWQIGFPADGLDVRTFGVKFDWDGTDGTATDNFTTLQNAFSFAWYKTTTSIDVGGTQGGQVLLPKQTAMIGCSGTVPIVVPYGVKVKGQGNYSSVIKMCNTFSTSVNQWELCNSFSHLACFGSLLEDFQIFNQFDIIGASSRSTVYTNNAQHEAGMRRMAIYPGACGRAATYETGYGGATYILLDSVEFKGGQSSANCLAGGSSGGAQVFINYGTTQVIVDNLNVSGLSAGSGGPREFGLLISGGFVDIRGVHAEQVLSPVTINIAGGVANGMVRARNAIGGVDCVGMFTLPNGNTFGNFMLSPPMAQNGCTHMVVNNMAGGAGNFTAASATDVVFISGSNKAW